MANRTAAMAGQKTNRVDQYKIAVLVPCYNEEVAIAKVVRDFRAALPNATVFVFDNNSTDKTAAAARAAGAEVFAEKRQGKGFVVRRMFTDVEADIYVLVDGDATYDAPSAGAMVQKLLDGRLDMVVASRVDRDEAAYRAGHRTGNRLLTWFVGAVFGAEFKDMLSENAMKAAEKATSIFGAVRFVVVSADRVELFDQVVEHGRRKLAHVGSELLTPFRQDLEPPRGKVLKAVHRTRDDGSIEIYAFTFESPG